MKSLIKYYFLVIVILFISSCEDPLPIELVDDGNSTGQYDVDVITQEPNSAVFTGYDSTGITNSIPLKSSVISVSGIKNSYKNATVSKGYAEAIFYNTDQPIKTSFGDTIGFKTLLFGRVTFNGNAARVVPQRLFYRENGVIRDTLVGVKHILITNTFPYHSNINFHFDFFGVKPFLQTIKTPPEITAKLKVTGSRQNNDLRVELKWNAAPKGEVILIIGGLLTGRKEIIPLLRVKSIKTNRVVIRNSLLQKIPFEKYDGVIFTLVRRFQFSISTIRLGDIYIASQSIHNIRIDIPKN
ncbi:hypothetical protein BMS3Abin04_00433 [bacterium BMS3Abin04]|nr:hypothetical protein BMS3Abin04_00433 [bacterium BMS3Abin04]